MNTQVKKNIVEKHKTLQQKYIEIKKYTMSLKVHRFGVLVNFALCDQYCHKKN